MDGHKPSVAEKGKPDLRERHNSTHSSYTLDLTKRPTKIGGI